MILRYLVLFGGIVMMITGCNSLVSQNFGTHRLRTIGIGQATAQSIGEADFVEIAGAVIGTVAITNAKADIWDETTVLRPLLSPEQQSAWKNGSTVETHLIGWFKTENLSCYTDPTCLPYTGKQAVGLIGEPAETDALATKWNQHRIKLKAPVVYLQLGEKPMAWYWNLLILVGGVCLAFIPEAVRHNRKPANKS